MPVLINLGRLLMLGVWAFLILNLVHPFPRPMNIFVNVALIFTSIAMMNLIERVFNRIWRVRQERRWTKRLLVYWAIVTLGPLLVGVSLTVTSRLFMATSGVVVSKPTPTNTISRSGFCWARVSASSGEYTVWMMAPSILFWRDRKSVV